MNPITLNKQTDKGNPKKPSLPQIRTSGAGIHIIAVLFPLATKSSLRIAGDVPWSMGFLSMG
jgi:hypothetical protein